MSTYKHIPPDKPEEVSWVDVKDWFVGEVGGTWDVTLKYTILTAYNNKFFPKFAEETSKPVVHSKPIRYLNRV